MIRRTDGVWFAYLCVITACLNGVFTGGRLLISYRTLDLGGDGTALGLITAAYSLVPLLVAIPVGRASGGRLVTRMLQLGAGVTMVALALTAASTDILALAIGSTALGFAQILSAVSSQGLIPAKAPPAEYDRRFGGLALSISAGQALGIPVAGALASLPGLAERTTLPLLAMMAAVLPVCGLAFSPRLRPPGRPEGEAASRRQSTLTMLSIRGMRPAMFSSLIVLTSVDLMTAYLPALGEQQGYPVLAVTLILTARSLTSVVSRFFLGRMIAAIPRRLLLTSATLCSAVPILLIPALPNPVVVGVLLGVAGFFWGIGQPMTMTWVATLVDASNRASALSLRLSGNRFGQVLIPLGAGAVAGSAGTGSVFILTGSLLAGAGVVTFRALRKDHHPRPRGKSHATAVEASTPESSP